MTSTSQLFDPYAEALMAIAREQGLEDRFGEDAALFRSTLAASADLRQLLENPTLFSSQKKAVLNQVFGSSVHPTVLNFLNLLVDRNRIAFLDGIADRYQALLRQLRNVVRADVTSAVPLTETQVQVITDKVKQLTGAAGVEIESQVDADLLGGVIIKVGSQVLDASLRGQLKRISISLAA